MTQMTDVERRAKSKEYGLTEYETVEPWTFEVPVGAILVEGANQLMMLTLPPEVKRRIVQEVIESGKVAPFDEEVADA